ncbi:hypothetical protein VTN31DRAFT_302 [Thermomyces dupontii]|uniref:uncharacterized protein n=1 Tax=Talaromyces thermophilus TaxID=28565 RepID=UPI003743568D
MPVNLSLYLVTDSTPAILKGRDLFWVVEEALKGGVTVVQYRDKTSDTGVLIETAKKLHAITRRYNVPLIVNDRVDVAIAAGAEGVHLGQDDMSLVEARKILPKDAIVGISVSTGEEAVLATQQGADYVGIGTLFATPTKTNTKNIIGSLGCREILEAIGDKEGAPGAVAIGGINLSTVRRVMIQSQATCKALDGVAVVSAIMSAEDPKAAAEALSKRIEESRQPLPPRLPDPSVNQADYLSSQVPKVVQTMVSAHPLVHNMINYVVANFAANVALAAGFSPIMSPYGDEAKDLAIHNGGLVINMGTLTSESVPEYLKAIAAYNAHGNPVVFDPVGAGATHIRRAAVETLMKGGYFDLIKGNEGEIKQVFGQSKGVAQRGVDSGQSTLSDLEKAKMARDLARRERNVVLMTGAVDYLSDGWRVIAIHNGHEFLGQVTGTGCSLGTIAAAFLTTYREDKLLAVLAAALVYEIAAENAAAAKDRVRGPGSFVPAFLDELYAIREAALQGSDAWFIGRAKIEEIRL